MNAHELKGVSNVFMGPDGKTINLTLTTNNGATLPLTFQHAAFTEFISNLIRVGAAASQQRTGGKRVPFSGMSQPTMFNPSPATTFALAESADRSQMFFVVRLFDMDLSFDVEKSELKQLAGTFAQAVQALDADETNPH